MPKAGGPGRGSGADEFKLERYLGIGCVTVVGGFFSGGMIAVLVAKIVGMARRCDPPVGLPACDWQGYMLTGAVIGMITLPAGVIWRLRSRRPRGEGIDEGQGL